MITPVPATLRTIGRTSGRDLRWSEMPVEEARAMLATAFR